MRLLAGWCLVLVVAFAAMTGCASGPAVFGHSDAEGTLRVGIATDYAPIAFSENGELKGIEPDFAQLLAYDLKREVVLLEQPWEALIPALLEGRIDVIMSGMSITAERMRQMSFAKPYMRVGQMALFRTGEFSRFGTERALLTTHARVGYQRDTTGEVVVRKRLKHATPVAFESVESGIEALRAGGVAYFIHDAPTVWRIANDPRETMLAGLFTPLTEEYLAWAVRKQDEGLRRRLNERVAAWQESGLLKVVLSKWIPVSVELRPALRPQTLQ